jgi:hypothetical protein
MRRFSGITTVEGIYQAIDMRTVAADIEELQLTGLGYFGNRRIGGIDRKMPVRPFRRFLFW